MLTTRLLRFPKLFGNIRSFSKYFSPTTNDELVSSLKSKGVIKSPLVESVMRSVDRKDFVPASYSKYAYDDVPLPIGYNATISAPHMHAFALV